MFNVDHFKKINDTHGHPVGDAVLTEIGERARPALRRDDFFARYGGEEFAVLCGMANMQQAALIGERLRQAIVDRPFLVGDLILPVTVSVGVSAFPTAEVRSSALTLRTGPEAAASRAGFRLAASCGTPRTSNKVRGVGVSGAGGFAFR